MKLLELKLNQKISWLVVGIASALFLLFIMVVLPKMATYSEEAIGVIASPDTEIMYTGEELYDIVDSYGDEGRSIYVKIRWTFDVIWPLVYLFFLMTLTIQLTKFSRFEWMHKLYLIPIIATAFDYLENIFVTIVMLSYPKEMFLIGNLASIVSFLKWLILVVAFVNIIIILIVRILKSIGVKV